MFCNICFLLRCVFIHWSVFYRSSCVASYSMFSLSCRYSALNIICLSSGGSSPCSLLIIVVTPPSIREEDASRRFSHRCSLSCCYVFALLIGVWTSPVILNCHLVLFCIKVVKAFSLNVFHFLNKRKTPLSLSVIEETQLSSTFVFPTYCQCTTLNIYLTR